MQVAEGEAPLHIFSKYNPVIILPLKSLIILEIVAIVI